MALMNCPRCGNRYSSQLSDCPDCGLNPESSDIAAIKKAALRAFRGRIYRLQMASYTALTLFTAGFIWYYIESKQFHQSVSYGIWILMGVGVIAYVVIRIMMILTKLDYRKKTRYTGR